jgi:hypothetical protein
MHGQAKAQGKISRSNQEHEEQREHGPTQRMWDSKELKMYYMGHCGGGGNFFHSDCAD